MNRRDFITYSTAAFFSALVADSASGRELKLSCNMFAGAAPASAKGTVRPWPAVTAAVDVLVPADPEIEGDFKGSDYGADKVLAAYARLCRAGFFDHAAQPVCPYSCR